MVVKLQVHVIPAEIAPVCHLPTTQKLPGIVGLANEDPSLACRYLVTSSDDKNHLSVLCGQLHNVLLFKPQRALPVFSASNDLIEAQNRDVLDVRLLVATTTFSFLTYIGLFRVQQAQISGLLFPTATPARDPACRKNPFRAVTPFISDRCGQC